jgi:cobalt-zinc-cadmium efflux system membrane fusion protein
MTSAEGSEEIVITREQFESTGMKLGDPELTTFSQKVRATGYIASSPGGIAEINSLISGRVKNTMLSVGDQVKKGQMLFTLESTEIIRLQQAYAEGYNEVKALKASFDRQKSLADEGITSQKEFINTESEYRSLLAKVDGLKAQLRMINIDPSEVEKGKIVPVATIRAPISGYVTKQELVMGQFIDPQKMLMEIVDIEQLRLNISVFEEDLKNMVPGQEVLFYDPDDKQAIYKARLSHIGKSIDRETKSISCIAELTEADKDAMVNGMFVETDIITCHREALAVPSEALIKEDDRYFLLVKVDERAGNLIMKKTAVQIGTVTLDNAEVLTEGLKDVLLVGAYYMSAN